MCVRISLAIYSPMGSVAHIGLILGSWRGGWRGAGGGVGGNYLTFGTVYNISVQYANYSFKINLGFNIKFPRTVILRPKPGT